MKIRKFRKLKTDQKTTQTTRTQKIKQEIIEI